MEIPKKMYLKMNKNVNFKKTTERNRGNITLLERVTQYHPEIHLDGRKWTAIWQVIK